MRLQLEKAIAMMQVKDDHGAQEDGGLEPGVSTEGGREREWTPGKH